MSTCFPLVTPPRKYLVGNAVTVTVVLTNSEGEVVEPENLRMLVSSPSDPNNSYVVSMTADGDRAAGTIFLDVPGTWRYRVETYAGPVNAAIERIVIAVARSVPAP